MLHEMQNLTAIKNKLDFGRTAQVPMTKIKTQVLNNVNCHTP